MASERTKRRDLLNALAETPVLPRRSATLERAGTLGAIVRSEPQYAPPTALLFRIGAEGECRPPRRSVLVASMALHPPHDGVDPLLGPRPLRPPRSAANLLHQVLGDLWSLDEVPVAEVAESGATEACGAEERPARSGAPLESQVPPPEELVEVAEPPQAEARRPQTCEDRCGPVRPGARALAARTGRRPSRGDPECRRAHKFEDDYTPVVIDRAPEARGKPGANESPCPCECKCYVHLVGGFPPRKQLKFVDWVFSWLGPILEFAGSLRFPEASIGLPSPLDQAGRLPVHGSGSSPVLDALRGGQSQGLGMFSGRDLDLGVMRPDLTLTALATSGIPGPAALGPPDLPGGDASVFLALRGDERASGQAGV